MQLINGPQARPITEQLLERVAGTRALFLVPTERHAAELAVRLPAGVETLTFPRFAERLSGQVQGERPSEVQQRLILERILQDLAARGRIKSLAPHLRHRGFVANVFAFVSELRGKGISAAEFAAAATELTQGRPRAKDTEVACIAANYDEILARHGWPDRSASYAQAAERIGPLFDRLFPHVGCIGVVGFVNFTPAQLKLLGLLDRRVTQLLITLPGADEGRQELFGITDRTSGQLIESGVRKRATVHEIRDVAGDDRPAGLSHLRKHLFREDAAPATSGEGVAFIEGPGPVGESRLAARAVKQLLLGGTAPEEILITARTLDGYAELLAETFSAYGIPCDIEAARPLLRQPLVATLLKAARLADDDWPFRDTVALLCSSFFAPDWPELGGDPELPLDADLVLRELNEPRGRTSVINAAEKFANQEFLVLEDEEAEGARRQRMQALAQKCLPFLKRFFAAWDRLPAKAPLPDYIAGLREFAEDLGFQRTANEAEQAAMTRWLDELSGWSSRSAAAFASDALTRPEFLHLAGVVAGSLTTPISEADRGVRIVPAELATGLAYDHLFILGMGERSFPRLGGIGGLYDESERQEFASLGVDLEVATERYSFEMLLFYRLIDGARQSVTMCYPAVDEKGQELLPGTFLRASRMLVPSAAVVHRKMLIEGLDTDPPLCSAEYRYRFAADESADVPAELAVHLRRVRAMTLERFQAARHGPFEGRLADPRVRNDVAKRFGPRRTFSPTSLETYIACPFKFLLGHVLGLAALPEPTDDVDLARRGSAIHRALARQLRQAKAGEYTSAGRLARGIDDAIDEYVQRAGSPITKLLWQLEGQRLKRFAQRLPEHWSSYQKPWTSGTGPQPFGVEVDLPTFVFQVDGVEVRLAGRIDRVDVVELKDGSLGYFVIDYKSGKGSNYTGTAVRSYEAVQLPVYALLAEAWFGSDRRARPLAMLYWLPLDSGPKAALPKKLTDWIEADGWPAERTRLQTWLAGLVGRIRAAEFPLAPRSEHCTSTCAFSTACRISQARAVEKEWSLPLPIVEASDDE